ncbi:hypothetical protein BH09ACT11_BH09ACT11_02950 [soil metagenome]
MNITAPDTEPPPAPTDLQVTEAGLGLPAQVDAGTVYDVVINGRPVWSVTPARDGAPRRGGHHVGWPAELARRLVGRADVDLREHSTGTVVAGTHHVFGGRDDLEVAITDSAGRPLVIDKYGHLIRPLSSEDADAVTEIMDQVEHLLTVLREDCGVPAYISYGTLLGAVRDGRLIGHDNDIDLSYVSSHTSPVDVAREAFRVERCLVAHGWAVRRGSGARINVRVRMSDGSMRFIDVFTSHWVDGVYYQPSDTGFELETEAILPLGEVTLMGRTFPAPADPERLLALTYGPNWRTPDPSFKYETPAWLHRRLAGWFGGLTPNRSSWDVFYGKRRGEIPQQRTDFAAWVQRNYRTGRPLIDLGAGTARDALWFANRRGRRVLALDYSLGVLNRASRKASAEVVERSRLEFRDFNLNDTRQVLSLGTEVSRWPRPVDLYGRFLWHAVDRPARDNVLRLASMVLRTGGRLFLEFRTPDDAATSHHFPRSRRDYVSVDEVVTAIRAKGGTVLFSWEGTGVATLEDEDPRVGRVVATWTTPTRATNPEQVLEEQ